MEINNIKLQVGVKVILKYDNKILLLKRSSKYENIQDLWDIPGGRIDPHETLMQGLARELDEEVGFKTINISDARLVTAQDILKPDKGFHVVRLSFELDLDKEQEVVISDESKEFKWFSKSDLVSCETIDPFLRETLTKIGYF